MWKRKRKNVLQSARANGDWMRRPPGHFITGAGRQEMMRKGGGEELVAASKQFRRSHEEKSARLGLVALTVGHAHASEQGASKRGERMWARNRCNMQSVPEIARGEEN